LQKITQKVSVLKTGLGNLSNKTCSDDFSLKLRERIHTGPQYIISKQNVVRISFAFSFVVIMVFATLSLNIFSDSPELDTSIQKSSEFQNQTANPAPNPVSGNNKNTFNKEEVIDVKTKGSQETYQDSTRISPQINSETRTKRVEQKK